jgi:hypothetical protein
MLRAITSLRAAFYIERHRHALVAQHMHLNYQKPEQFHSNTEGVSDSDVFAALNMTKSLMAKISVC